MSDPMNTSPPIAPPPAAPAAPSPMNNMLARFSQAELMIAGGALLLVLVELIFGIVTRDYSIGPLPWAIATVTLLAVLGPRLARISLPMSSETIIVMAGITIAFVGVRDLAYDLRSISGPSGASATFMLAMVGYYLGVVLMAVGAWMLWRGRRA